MVSSAKKILVVGGGIAGLALAVTLRDRGIETDLVEIKKEWTVYGVGIIQQSNVVRAMAQLGLLDHYLASSFSFEKACIYDLAGNLQAVVPGKRLAGPQYPANLGISRLALHEILTSAARGKGTEVRLGVSVEALEQDGERVYAKFTDGSKGVYDLVVGADGIFSKTRALVFPEAPEPRFTGQSVWRYNFPRPTEIDHLAAFNGPGGSAGLVPLSNEVMYMYVTSAEPGNPRMPADQLHLLMQDRIKQFGGWIGKLRPQITDPAKVVYKPMETLMMPAPWFRGRVVLIGDAAHSTTPHLGQGAGIAIEDALVLGQELDSGDPIEIGLQRFMKRRYERCKYVVETSLQLGEWQMQGIAVDNGKIVNEMLEVTSQPI
jgi:2-polyprenyl-6-methoxyphenol hydroxylase-like FAD-dependent oxidoreductase